MNQSSEAMKSALASRDMRIRGQSIALSKKWRRAGTEQMGRRRVRREREKTTTGEAVRAYLFESGRNGRAEGE